MLRSLAPGHPLTLAVATFIVTPSYVYAESACPIGVEPSKPEVAWHEKARRAEETLAQRDEKQHDCRSIRIEVQPEGNALLTFTTVDGRIAVRLLHAPDDILPVVEALLVTLPVETPLEMSAKEKPTPIPVAPVHPPPSPPAATNRNAPVRPNLRLLLHASAGARLGLESRVFAPLISAQALMLFEPWELGFGGEWNPIYLPLANSAPTGYLMRSFEANLLFGRRIVRGPQAWDAGLTLGIAAVHEETDADPTSKGRVNIDAVQPRVGFYGGLVKPYASVLRFRLGLQGDVALWGIREGGTAKRNLPSLSRFGLGLSVGMEVAP